MLLAALKLAVLARSFGLTLTANELFAAGLWTINDDFTIQVAKSAFAETRLPSSPHFLLADLHGQPLHFAPASPSAPTPPTSPGTVAPSLLVKPDLCLG